MPNKFRALTLVDNHTRECLAIQVGQSLIRNSKVADLVKELQSWGVTVVVTDPWADAAEVKHEYGITLGDISPQNPVDSLVISVGHQEFRTLTPETLKSYCTTAHQPVAADLKTLYDRHAMAAAGFTVFRL